MMTASNVYNGSGSGCGGTEIVYTGAGDFICVAGGVECVELVLHVVAIDALLSWWPWLKLC